MGGQCRDKWYNILNSFNNTKDSSTKTEGDTTKMKSFQHFIEMNRFMADKHQIAMPFVRNSGRKSSTFSASKREVSFLLHPEEQENEEDGSGVPKKKGKGHLKDERWHELFDKQTKVLEASQKNQENYLIFCQAEARGQELIITAIGELCTVIISGIKNGDKVKAGVNFRLGRLNTMREQA